MIRNQTQSLDGWFVVGAWGLMGTPLAFTSPRGLLKFSAEGGSTRKNPRSRLPKRASFHLDSPPEKAFSLKLVASYRRHGEEAKCCKCPFKSPGLLKAPVGGRVASKQGGLYNFARPLYQSGHEECETPSIIRGGKGAIEVGMRF